MKALEPINVYLEQLYPENWEEASEKVCDLINKWKKVEFPSYEWIKSNDIMLISYGDGIMEEGKAPLATLHEFMKENVGNEINLIHLLPMFPYSSDDGFSVIDFRQIDPALGSWDDIQTLKKDFNLMFDAVLNHASVKSQWFDKFLQWESPYRDYFIVADPDADYSKVVRPRTSPLLTPFDTADGKKYVWTTFSDDQIDLNYKSPDLLLEMLDVLLTYASRGARFVRFDAIGFAWKELGTSCMHLPQAHTLIKLMRIVLESCAPGCSIITETNVPHAENISYFGNGNDEAALVYQFPLPPLVFFSFLSEDASILSEWADRLEKPEGQNCFFNFLASHDGIGMRPVEDMLSDEQRQQMVDATLNRGGEIGYRSLPDGHEVPYELNINYLDAIAGDLTSPEMIAQKFTASQCILLSMAGMPGIYYHSLLGSRGWREGVEESGIKRRINREKLNISTVRKEIRTTGSLRNLVINRYKKMLTLRKKFSAFNPSSKQNVLHLDPRIFALERGEGAEKILVLVNVSSETLDMTIPIVGQDLFSGQTVNGRIELRPWQYCWIEQK